MQQTNISRQNPTVLLAVVTLNSGSKCPGLLVDWMFTKYSPTNAFKNVFLDLIIVIRRDSMLLQCLISTFKNEDCKSLGRHPSLKGFKKRTKTKLTT